MFRLRGGDSRNGADATLNDRLVAIVVAMPLLFCSRNLNRDSDKPQVQSAQASQDDTSCQSSGFTLGTPRIPAVPAELSSSSE